MHGAGLANTVFMPNGGDVIELLAESTLDVRHLPLVGIFPRLSFIGGLNHFSLLISDVKQASNLSNHPVLTEIYLMTQIRWFYEAKSVRPKSW